jgi:hypothetical protein
MGLVVKTTMLSVSRYDIIKVRIYVKFYKKTKSSLKLRRDDFVSTNYAENNTLTNQEREGFT